MNKLAFFVFFACAVAIVFSQTPTNYGSYVAQCQPEVSSLTFVNYPERDCVGTATKKTYPLNICQTELLVASWKAACNSTTSQFFNYLGTSCSGSSVLTRTYDSGVCRNCNNAACKD
eukprot:TRINITY_DN3378_c0_g1_i2.p1 TRINITY_DN3378_c0_g1~~TRINITY_DN3378_c0_g1_i2.p1  ORF type:complete len:117 (-),score=28.93 TRINITY_DN3378_c0_g1_i2:67-417(-)